MGGLRGILMVYHADRLELENSGIKMNAPVLNSKQIYTQPFSTETCIGTQIVPKYDIDAICTSPGFYWIGLLSGVQNYMGALPGLSKWT